MCFPLFSQLEMQREEALQGLEIGSQERQAYEDRLERALLCLVFVSPHLSIHRLSTTRFCFVNSSYHTTHTTKAER